MMFAYKDVRRQTYYINCRLNRTTSNELKLSDRLSQRALRGVQGL